MSAYLGVFQTELLKQVFLSYLDVLVVILLR